MKSQVHQNNRVHTSFHYVELLSQVRQRCLYQAESDVVKDDVYLEHWKAIMYIRRDVLKLIQHI